MPTSSDEREAAQHFAERYGRRPTDATRELERLAIGGDFGANGYTTVAQADRLAETLRLDDRSLLLDVGSGRGWPGLYLAATRGSRVVLTDLPFEGLVEARRRARAQGSSRRTSVVLSSARRLPFRDEIFDAVTHTDVLC